MIGLTHGSVAIFNLTGICICHCWSWKRRWVLQTHGSGGQWQYNINGFGSWILTCTMAQVNNSVASKQRGFTRRVRMRVYFIPNKSGKKSRQKRVAVCACAVSLAAVGAADYCSQSQRFCRSEAVQFFQIFLE